MSLVLLAAPAGAIAPLLVLVGKQIVQDTIFNAVKGKLIASLAGMGCKGARLAGLVAAGTAKFHPGSGLGGMAGAGPNMATGMPGGTLPPGVSMPGMPGMPGMGGGESGKAMGQAIGVGPGHVDLPAMSPEAGGDMSQVLLAMQAKYGGSGAAMTPDQMARAQETMRRMQLAMQRPLSRTETLEVFDELKSLGVLTESMHSEARDCIQLAPNGSDQTLGQTGAIFKELVLPQLRDTKAKLENLRPEEQDQLAQGIAEALRDAKPADRDAFREGLGLGFFPQPVVEKAISLAR